MNTLREPQGACLEFGFYLANTPDAVSLPTLVRALVGLGATLSGTALVQRGANLRDAPFAGVYDLEGELVRVEHLAELQGLVADEDTRLIHVHMRGASGTTADIDEVVSYASISPEASGVDTHPVRVITEGWLFTDPLLDEDRARRPDVGRRAYHRFRALIVALRPAYASMSVEWTLECPADLRRNPNTYAFRDFYVSRAYLGEPAVNTIAATFAGAYQELVADGVYISGYPAFNPRGAGFDHAGDASHPSAEVVRIIASTR